MRKLIDNLYLRACNLVLDYGGLAVSAVGGAALGDYNHAVFNETLRSNLVAPGFIGAFAAPGADSLFGSGNLFHSNFDGDATFQNNYIGSQACRNMFAYFAAWQLAEGCKSNSPLIIATGLAITGLAVAGHIIGRKSKRELEARIRERTAL